MAKKYGRKPAVHTKRTMRLALAMARTLDPLGTPPPLSKDYVAAVTNQDPDAWGMMLNDQLGDCVCADTGHRLMLSSANTGAIIIPTNEQIEKLYEYVGNYNPADPSTDQGCDETTMCAFLMKNGFLGQKIAGTGPVDPTNLAHVKWCVELFGACRLGINVPDYFETQFDNGQPWDVEGDPANANIIGGHDIPIVKYDGTYLYVVTWGQLQPMTPAALLAFTEEAHAELWDDWIAASGNAPSGVDLITLIKDLAYIEQTS